jgi:4-amino-4-deoxy-L-arabinose transferase-like glycosyltransferase
MPSALSRAVIIGAAGVGLVAFVVYLLTLQRSVPAGDSGELIAAASVLGVAHPPGYPLFTLLGHVATWLPFGSPALRVNLLSAVWDAIAVALVFVIVHRLTSRREIDLRHGWPALVAAATAALLLAFSTPFWSYAVVAEVFALNNLFAAVLLLVGLEWWRRPDRPWLLWVLAFTFGLALTNQQTIVLLVPALAVLAWSGWRGNRRAARQGTAPRVRLKDAAIAAALFVAGLLPYLYVALAARSDPAINWGDPRTFDRFFDLITRANYGTLQLTAEGRTGSISEQLGLQTSSLASALVYVGLALAIVGAVWTFRRRRAAGVALLLAFLFAGPVFVAYAKAYIADDLTKGVLERFYILPSIPLAILAGAGAWQLLLWAERIPRPTLRPYVAVAAGVALLAVPVASAAAHYGTADQSDNDVVLHYAQDLLRPLEPNALLLMRSDENFTSVFYAQQAEGLRRDVVALDAELLKLDSTVEQIRRQHPDVQIPWESYDGGATT